MNEWDIFRSSHNMIKEKTLAAGLILGLAASASAVSPLVFDKKIGYYKDLSYDALTGKDLSRENISAFLVVRRFTTTS